MYIVVGEACMAMDHRHDAHEMNPMIKANKAGKYEVRIGVCRESCPECCMDDCVENYYANSGTCDTGSLGPYGCICHFC